MRIKRLPGFEPAVDQAHQFAPGGAGHGRGGVFWRTQGRSFWLVCFAQKVLHKVADNWTFVVVTGRAELDDQLFGQFAELITGS